MRQHPERERRKREKNSLVDSDINQPLVICCVGSDIGNVPLRRGRTRQDPAIRIIQSVELGSNIRRELRGGDTPIDDVRIGVTESSCGPSGCSRVECSLVIGVKRRQGYWKSVNLTIVFNESSYGYQPALQNLEPP